MKSTSKWYESTINEIDDLYILSDIHSNLPALSAVLAAIPAGAKIACAGDIVGYYTEPNEVCELLRAHDVACILGNHDLYVLGRHSYDNSRENKYRTIWTRERLSSQNRLWLASLPTSLTLQVQHSSYKNREIKIHHGSLFDVEEYIYPDTPFNSSQIENNNFMVLGHTHHPMIRRYGSAYLINPGSVGQPRDKNPDASYAVIDLYRHKVNLLRAKYDVFKYQEKLKQQHLIMPVIEMLSQRKL